MSLTEIMLMAVVLMLLLLCLNTSVLVTQISGVLDHLTLLNDLYDDGGDDGGSGGGYRFDPDPNPDSPRDTLDIDLAWREAMRAAKTK